MTNQPYLLLEKASNPEELRQLSIEELAPLADELRRFLINSVAHTGGHLSAGLGTVELTIALHYVFNTPDDRLVWDVGHQSYLPRSSPVAASRWRACVKKGDWPVFRTGVRAKTTHLASVTPAPDS